MFATVGIEFFRFTTKFRGQTDCATISVTGERCADYELWEPWPEVDNQVVGGLLDPVEDNYLRLGLTIGYAY